MRMAIGALVRVKPLLLFLSVGRFSRQWSFIQRTKYNSFFLFRRLNAMVFIYWLVPQLYKFQFTAAILVYENTQRPIGIYDSGIGD